MKPGTLRWLNIAFALIIVIAAGKFYAAHYSSSAVSTSGLPDKLKIDGVSWNHEKTLVLFLQTTCTYCHQSAAFHSELAELAKVNGWGVVAVFPESAAMGKVALEKAGIDGGAVEADLTSLGVSGTPTLAIVDGDGKVEGAWAGLLDDARKREVFNAFGLLPNQPVVSGKKNVRDLGIRMVTVSDAAPLLKDADTLLVDIRPREYFKEAHLAGAVNIPRDELETRAIHELDRAKKIVVFCQYLPECEKASKEAGLMTNCTVGAWYLRSVGFNAVLLQSDIPGIAKSGYPLALAAKASASIGH